MTTTPNPTPIGPQLPPDDPVDDPMDSIPDEPVPDGQGGWVDDHTGIHPTATTYSTIIVGTSTTGYPTEYATPTPSSYHVDYPDSDVDFFNDRVGGKFLTFYDGYREWSEYSHSLDPTKNVLWTTEGKPTPWVTGYKPRYSWDYSSELTGNNYNAIVPTMVFWVPGKPQVAYYFFEEVFNDFQAHFGYDAYVYKLDGYPAAHWPGVIKTVRSTIGANQRPIERDRYESWFVMTYGELFYMAPYTYKLDKMSLSTGRPTRFANTNPTRTGRDDPVVAGDPVDMTSDLDMSEVSDEVQALQDAVVARAVSAQKATDAAAQTKAINDALASSAITQQQALLVQQAASDADKASVVAGLKVSAAKDQAAAVASAIAAGNLSQQQAVAAQASSDAAAQSAALAAQATANAANLSQKVATAVANQAATDATQQAAAVAAQKTADTAAQTAAVAAQASADATAQATAIANAVAAQQSTDAANQVVAVQKAFAGLPQASAMTSLPTFTNGSVSSGYAGSSFTLNKSLSGMDYSRAWLMALPGVLPYPTPSSTSYANVSAAQAVSGTAVVSLWSPSYYSYTTAPSSYTIASGHGLYSGWMRNSKQTSLVGFVFALGNSSGYAGSAFATLGYGYTSLSPTATSAPSNGTASTTYLLKTSNVQAEIMNNCVANSGAVGFVYDATVGSYGQVTWISQI